MRWLREAQLRKSRMRAQRRQGKSRQFSERRRWKSDRQNKRIFSYTILVMTCWLYRVSQHIQQANEAAAKAISELQTSDGRQSQRPSNRPPLDVEARASGAMTEPCDPAQLEELEAKLVARMHGLNSTQQVPQGYAGPCRCRTHAVEGPFTPTDPASDVGQSNTQRRQIELGDEWRDYRSCSSADDTQWLGSRERSSSEDQRWSATMKVCQRCGGAYAVHFI